jgi:hypothetical protein
VDKGNTSGMSIAERSVAELTGLTQEFVGTDAHVQVALLVYGRHPLVSAGFLGWLFGKPRILAATDEDIRLLDIDSSQKGSTIAPGELLATYPRDTAIGPPKGVHYKVVLPDGQKVYIHRLHFDHVRRIDGEVVED